VTTDPRRSLVRPLAPQRYEIRFTARAETREKLRRAQDLLRHAVSSGDPAEIIDRALTALLDQLAKKKQAATERPAAVSRATRAGSRHVPAAVRREVWRRDEGRCGFVAKSGRRCGERGFLELHHVRPYGVGGEATAENLELRCRSHNAYEAELFYVHRQDEEKTTRSGPCSQVSSVFGHGTLRQRIGSVRDMDGAAAGSTRRRLAAVGWRSGPPAPTPSLARRPGETRG
jgi:hypothetical protein